MNLCCINCLKITNNLGKITIYYDDEFKDIKIYPCCNECGHGK